MQHSAESIFVVEYLRKHESIFETALAHESVDPGVFFDEKKPEVENLVRLSPCGKILTFLLAVPIFS
jgi:hypothetical protein